MKVNEFLLILKPSTIPNAGIGAFAAEDIAKGVVVASSKGILHTLRHRSEVPDDFIHYCIAQGEDMWLCPADFNKMECSWFINHSSMPNVGLFLEGEYRYLKTICEIKKGEELVVDYNELDEPEYLKGDYSKN